MIAEYEGYVYTAIVRGDEVSLITYDKCKAIDGFEGKRDYYKKEVSLDDPMLISVYELHYLVRYKDRIENNELWCVDEGRPVTPVSLPENDEVTIDVIHSAADPSWSQFEKNGASKVVRYTDCSEFIIEKKYIRKNGRTVGEVTERSSVAPGVFKKNMIMNRRVNL